ncbi:MAG: PLP-dependent aminotransferase family protein [Bacteroidetes bacterium]|nr:PLP-dependent aminotransferase family protein [Bacteroidota bacterium]
MDKKELLYIQIANSIEHQIKSDVLKIGDKLPSIRTVCSERGVSISTVSQAYFELESRGFIESRPQSGYYVSYAHKNFRNLPSVSQPIMAKKFDKVEDIMSIVIQNFENAQIYLSSASLSPELVPIAKLNKSLVTATRTLKDSGVGYSKIGSIKLKTQIAKRSLSWGGKLQADDIITTGGSIDAISFCLLSLTKRGDTIVVESPVYFGILRLAQSLGLHVIELPTHPVSGIEVDALKKVIEKKKIKLCILITNFSNPMGSCMPDENKKEVVRLMEKHNIPLIEDDLYADLYFGNHRPTSCKTYDESGIVLWCGSFSKTLVSGYRVGWVAPGKFKDQVERTKLFHSMYSSTITHEAIGNFLEVGRYENHLRKTRQILHRNSLQFHRCISEYFPEDTKVTRPLGSMNLWVELNKKSDVIELYNKAIVNKISITPGRMYTLQNQYNNCFKLSYGMLWNEKVESALKLLGKLASH